MRSQVFANAQTGNVVLMSTRFMQGDWLGGIHCLLPLFAFAAGVFAAERFGYRHKQDRRFHWRQGILLMEIITLLIAGFLPRSMDMLANALISFSCAMQVQTFRKVGSNAYASTMCIGNLRSGTAALSAYLRSRSPRELERVISYFGVILVFALGAGLGGVLSQFLGIRAIWISTVFLLAGWLLMDLDRCR